MSLITPDDELILAQQGIETLAEWYALLNTFKWPTDLPNPEPPHHKAGGRRSELMAWIKEAIGERAVSRHWNRWMTDEEFNDFWRGVHEGHAPSLQRYNHRIADEDFGDWARRVAASRKT